MRLQDLESLVILAERAEDVERLAIVESLLEELPALPAEGAEPAIEATPPSPAGSHPWSGLERIPDQLVLLHGWLERATAARELLSGEAAGTTDSSR